jgi:peroxiredoxin Q/BCP
MAQLRQDYTQFTARNAEILVICPEEKNAVQAFWQRERLPFPGLADPRHRVADLYGQEVNLLKLGRMPELAIVDRAGLVRYIHHAGRMNDIPANKTLIDVLDELNKEHPNGAGAAATAAKKALS